MMCLDNNDAKTTVSQLYINYGEAGISVSNLSFSDISAQVEDAIEKLAPLLLEVDKQKFMTSNLSVYGRILWQTSHRLYGGLTIRNDLDVPVFSVYARRVPIEHVAHILLHEIGHVHHMLTNAHDFEARTVHGREVYAEDFVALFMEPTIHPFMDHKDQRLYRV